MPVPVVAVLPVSLAFAAKKLFPSRTGRICARSLLLVLCVSLGTAAQTPVLTQHNDNSRDGLDATESILTTANVNVTHFGKLFSLAVDGQVYAQPLYVPHVTINGVVHNVLIVATENDSVYAFDADTAGAPLWKASLVDAAHGAGAGETALNSATTIKCTDTQPLIGITSTPVIDSSTNTIYVEAKSTNGTNYFHRLHSLDVLTGNEKPPGPVVIRATVSGTGDGSVSGQLIFDSTNMAEHQQSRAGLLLLNGTIYMGFASHCDFTPYHGWLFAYDEASLTQKSVYVSTPNGNDGGYWLSGTGISADSSGNIYISDGNGTFDTTNVPPTETGDTIVKFGTANQILKILDYFTPFDQATLNSSDFDLGSGGLLLLPNQTGTHPHQLVTAGKGGRIYVIDRDQMTTNNLHYCSGCSSDTDIVEETGASAVGKLFGAPAFWNENIYYWGVNDVLRQIPFVNGLPDLTQVNTNSIHLGFPGATPSISSNGTVAGTAILWAVDSSQYGSPGPGPGPALLHAFDATNITNELWNSSQAPNSRDQAGNAVKFAVPTISNGKVYIGTSGEVDVYGLLNATPTIATPAISPSSESVSTSVTVTMNDATSGATIYYTLDGSAPSPTHGTVYTSAFTLTSSQTVRAMAASPGNANSLTATEIYTIQSNPASSINFSSGMSASGMTLSGSAKLSGTRLRLTDGKANEAGSAFFTTPVNVQSFTTDFSFQLTTANADGFTFTIHGGSTPAALGPNGGGLGYGPASPSGTPGIPSSVAVKFDLYNNAGEGNDSTGIYTDGASPTTPFVNLSSTGINLHGGDIFQVHMSYSGTTLAVTITDTTTETSFSTNFTNINIPSIVGSSAAYTGFTGGTGGQTATQDVLSWSYVSGSSSSAQPPSITTPPANQTVAVGQTATFSVTATGTAPLSYQWQKNSANISGATSSTYTTPPATSADNGSTFDVVVTNSAGSATSNSATLTVTSGSTINFGSGFTSTAGLQLNGNASWNQSASRLRLTSSSATHVAGSFFFTTPVNVQSFTDDFSFQLTSPNADGFTFTIQNVAPTSLGPSGGGLGYGPDSPTGTPGIASSLAVKFDLYSNAGEGSDSTGEYTDGASPTTPAVDMTASGVNLHSGDVMNVHMTYDGTTLSMTITDPTTGKTFTTSWNVNIPTVVGSNTAYVGFTGGTGGLTATQEILSWTYSSGAQTQAPAITTQPANQTVAAGQTATFSVTATGTAPLTYQWQKNGASISGATSPSYTTPPTTSADNGSTFNVVVTNSAGSATSNSATLTVTSASPTVNFASGFTSTTGLQLNGAATWNQSASRLRLTNGGFNQGGSFFFTTPVNVQSFTNDFSFQLTNAKADGFTFTIQNVGPSALGPVGGGLAYGGSSSSGTVPIASSVAVKFDLYSNAGEGTDSTGEYTDGASPTVPATDMTASGVNLHSGDVMNVHMTYDGTTLSMTITDPTAGETFTASWTVNIPTVVGSNSAYVGFTGSTGGLSSTQEIVSWSYTAGN